MTPLLGIDWGTTHRRAYWLDAHGRLLLRRQDDEGCLAARGRFEASLAALLADGPPLADGAPIVLAGMVGSAQGWQEAPYLNAATTPLRDWPRHLTPLEARAPDGRRVFIVPGCRWRDADGTPDVMRGEETQLLGALALGVGAAADGWYVLPGTHCKWVKIDAGRVALLRTYLSGELYALLSAHGTLAALMDEDSVHDDDDAFDRGARLARAEALSHALFVCRAGVVAGDLPAVSVRSMLGGLLVGAEWHDIAARHGGVSHARAIGAPAMVRSHARVARSLGATLEAIDPDAAFIEALRVIGATLADIR